MLTTRTSTRQLESHNATCSFDPTRIPPSSSSSSSHLVSPPQAKAAMTSTWSSAPPSSSTYIPDHQAFGHQDPAELAAAAARGAMRMGYATRSTTGTLPRNISIPEQTMGPATLFANGTMAQNGGMVRKKRRRYGPKPEPPYTCFCGKVFKRHEHMLRHRATHDDGIKYECHICGKCFRRQDVMHRHTMTHTSRSRLQNKMRNTASGTSSSAAAAGPSRKPAGEDNNSKVASSSRKREQEHIHLGHPGMMSQDLLEDPTLRVGLAEYPGTPSSSRHNEDHHIAAAQLYSACNGTRYSYPSYSVNMQPSHGADMSEAGYARSDSLGVMADYHSRMGSSMSPPPPFFPSPAGGFAQSSFEGGQFSVALGRPHLGLSTTFTGSEYEYEPKANGHEAGHYAQSWHSGYALAHGSVHMGASESEWSEQSPSGPSTHTFASPAWSQKAELMRRDGPGSISGGTPSGLSNRQLSMDPAARWHQHSHSHQPQPQYQQGSPLIGSDAGLPSFHRSPAYEPRRRLSILHPQDGYSNPAQDGHGGKGDSHNESCGAGLGLFDQSHPQSHESGSLGFFPTPTFTSASAVGGGGGGGGERLPILHHSSPHVTNGALLSSPSHYLGAGMNSMHVSQGSSSQHSASYAPESKPGFGSMVNASEPFDTGSPLTEATGNASPQSHVFGGSGGGRDSMHPEAKEEPSDPLLDPHLAGGNNGGYSSSSSTASAHGGQNSRRW
ncbi:related to b-induced zinc finger protein [Ustilago trichophora]|uniref:Related to b-induced zinc finger protein n=1 Tax=Ustilago trichophora TaxID=86804 RepID=A0A5C3E7U2_9BASI|nr:related to b-induced zinc finger protein [Ustilago trichophora]